MRKPLRVVLAVPGPGTRIHLRRLLLAMPGVEVVSWMPGSPLSADALSRAAVDRVIEAVGDDAEPADWVGQAPASPAVVAARALVLREPGELARGAGAGALLALPVTLEREGHDSAFAVALRQRLLGATAQPPSAQVGVRPPPAALRGGHGIVAIGASTGGPQALATVLRGLAGCLRVPVVITQHIAQGFTGELARSLTSGAGVETVEASEGLPLVEARAYLAPHGRHLRVAGQRGQGFCRLDDGPPEHFCRPAVDVMLNSLAMQPSWRPIVVILTGMGRDGLAGAQAVAAAGGLVIAQDESTSAVWGMPGAVVGAGLARGGTPLADIAPAILRALGHSR